MTQAEKAETPVIDLKGTRGTRKLQSSHLQAAEFARPDFRVVIEDITTTREDVLEPAFWANVGPVLKGTGKHKFAMVEVIWADGSRYMTLMVLACDRLWAKVVVIYEKELFASHEEAQAEFDQAVEEYDPANDPDFKVKHVNPTLSWCVIRIKDGERVAKNLSDRKAGEDWISDYRKTNLQ